MWENPDRGELDLAVDALRRCKNYPSVLSCIEIGRKMERKIQIIAIFLVSYVAWRKDRRCAVFQVVFIILFTCPKIQRLFWKANIFSANQSFLKTFPIALIG